MDQDKLKALAAELAHQPSSKEGVDILVVIGPSVALCASANAPGISDQMFQLIRARLSWLVASARSRMSSSSSSQAASSSRQNPDDSRHRHFLGASVGDPGIADQMILLIRSLMCHPLIYRLSGPFWLLLMLFCGFLFIFWLLGGLIRCCLIT